MYTQEMLDSIKNVEKAVEQPKRINNYEDKTNE